MIRAVIGVGPRVGTSFTMKSLIEAGLPVHWDQCVDDLLPTAGNTAGYYETDHVNLPDLSGVIVKVWPLAAHLASIEKAVILERNRDCQLASIEKQMVRERELLATLGIDWTAEDFIDQSEKALTPLLSIPHLRIRTEDLDDRIDDIITFMRY